MLRFKKGRFWNSNVCWTYSSCTNTLPICLEISTWHYLSCTCPEALSSPGLSTQAQMDRFLLKRGLPMPKICPGILLGWGFAPFAYLLFKISHRKMIPHFSPSVMNHGYSIYLKNKSVKWIGQKNVLAYRTGMCKQNSSVLSTLDTLRMYKHLS